MIDAIVDQVMYLLIMSLCFQPFMVSPVTLVRSGRFQISDSEKGVFIDQNDLCEVLSPNKPPFFRESEGRTTHKAPFLWLSRDGTEKNKKLKCF